MVKKTGVKKDRGVALRKNDAALILRDDQVRVVIPKIGPEENCPENMILIAAFGVMATRAEVRANIIGQFIKSEDRPHRHRGRHKNAG
jgi:hypothetical protein